MKIESILKTVQNISSVITVKDTKISDVLTVDWFAAVTDVWGVTFVPADTGTLAGVWLTLFPWPFWPRV